MSVSSVASLLNSSKSLVITPPVGASSLVAGQNGALVLLSTASTGNQITLPVAATAPGCSFKFVLATATAGANCTIAGSATNLLCGTLIVNAAKVAMAANASTLTVVSGTATKGDHIEVVCDGSSWYCNGVGQAAGSITVA